MKYMVATIDSGDAVFVVQGEQALNITRVEPSIGPDLSRIMAGAFSPSQIAEFVAAGEPTPVADLTPARPIARSGKMICLGLNYAAHAAEGGRDVPEYPVFFMRAMTSLCADGAAMILPQASYRFDYEAELLVYIGKGGRHIPASQALDHVFGYGCFNDGSIRDYQVKTSQWTAGKNFDSTGAVGKLVVSADELPAGATGLRIQSRIGDELLQDDNTANMIFSVAQAIELLSTFSRLESGDMIAMGTPSGVGFARRPRRWMKAGEQVEVSIEGIDVLLNPVCEEQL